MKSRTFVVIQRVGDRLKATTLIRLTSSANGSKKLLQKTTILPWPPEDQSAIVNFVADIGATARYYDPGERIWLDYSTSRGLVPAPGSADGTWGVPSLEEFEEDYLPIV